ncbi:MAG TPA: site-specific integrase [Actinomycetes bacterium]
MTRRSFGAVRRLPSGRWQARYWDVATATHLAAPVTFPTKTDANAWLAERQTEGRRGVVYDARAAKKTVHALVREHLDTAAAIGDLKPKTLDGYESLLRACIDGDPIATISVATLRARDVREWLTRLRQRRLSASRVRQAYRLVSAVCRRAVRDDVIPRNPCDGVELPRLPEARARFLETDEMDRLLAACPDEAQRAFLLTLAYGGLRWGEAAALRVRDVDLRHGTVRVDESLSAATDPRTGRHTLIFQSPKSRQSRTITVPTVVLEALRQRVDALPLNPDRLLWTTRTGGPLRYSSWKRWVWDGSVERAKLDAVNPHDLRRTCASHMFAMGFTVPEVQQHLGHADPSVTLAVYTQVTQGRARGAKARWDRYLNTAVSAPSPPASARARRAE